MVPFYAKQSEKDNDIVSAYSLDGGVKLRTGWFSGQKAVCTKAEVKGSSEGP